MDETETDVDILLECLKYQKTDFQAVKRSLQALASVFNSDGDSKEYFRKVGGLHLVQRLLSGHFPDSVQQAAVFCLACAVENDVYCQSSLTKMETFEFVHGVLSEKKQDRKWLQAAAYLVVNLVAGNSGGQQLVKESGVLTDLLNVFRQQVDRKRTSDIGQDQADLCLSVVTALSMCVNNPQNESNQRLCCTILPLCFRVVTEAQWTHLAGSLLAFAGLTVAGNGFNQRRMKSCGGVDTLLQLLDRCEREVHTHPSAFSVIPPVISVINACISDHEENAQYFVEKGGVDKIMTWLSGPYQLSLHHLLQLMLTLGYALEYADKTVAPLTPQHQTVLVQLLTDADDEELVRAVKYVLTSWQHLDEGEEVSANKQKQTDPTTQRMDRLASQIQHTADQYEDTSGDPGPDDTPDHNKVDTTDPYKPRRQYEDRDHHHPKGRPQREEENTPMNREGHQSSQSQYPSPYPDPPRPACGASTRVLPHGDRGPDRHPGYVAVAAHTDTHPPPTDDRRDVRQPGSGPTPHHTPVHFSAGLDGNAFRNRDSDPTSANRSAHFTSGPDSDVFRPQEYDPRSRHAAPQDSFLPALRVSAPVCAQHSSFPALGLSTPLDPRREVRDYGDQCLRGTHDHQAHTQMSSSLQPLTSLPAPPVSISLPQFTAPETRSPQRVLSQASVGLSQPECPVPFYSTHPMGNSHPVTSQYGEGSDMAQSRIAHQALAMPAMERSGHDKQCSGSGPVPSYAARPSVGGNSRPDRSQNGEGTGMTRPLTPQQPCNLLDTNCTMMSGHRDDRDTSVPVAYSHNQQLYPQNQQLYPQNQQLYPQNQQLYPLNQQSYPQSQQRPVCDPQQPAVTVDSVRPVPHGQFAQDVLVTQPAVSSSLSTRLPTFYYTRAAVGVPSSRGQQPAPVPAGTPLTPLCQAGTTGDTERPQPDSRLLPPTPRPRASPCAPHPGQPAHRGQAGVPHRSSQPFQVPALADHLPAGPSSTSAVLPPAPPPVEDAGLMMACSVSARPAVLSEEGRQQGSWTGHLWRQNIPRATAVGSTSMLHAPTMSTIPWPANGGSATQANCGRDTTLGYSSTHSQHHCPTFIHNLSAPAVSDQSALSFSVRPIQGVHSAGPAGSSGFVHYPNTTAGSSTFVQYPNSTAGSSTCVPPFVCYPNTTAVFQQQRCQANVHGSHCSAECCESDGHGGEKGNAVCSTVPCSTTLPCPGGSAPNSSTLTYPSTLSCPETAPEETGDGGVEPNTVQAAVRQSPPLITDTCEMTLLSGLEDTVTVAPCQNDSGYNTSVNNSDQLHVSENHNTTNITPEHEGKRPDVSLPVDSRSSQPPDGDRPARSLHTPNQFAGNAVALKHNKPDGVFRVPFPKQSPAGLKSCMDSGAKPSPCVSPAVQKSSPLSAQSVRRKGLRRAPSKTPDMRLSRLGVVTTPTQNKTLIRKAHPNEDNELLPKQSNELRPAMTPSSHGIPASPAASEFDCQLLKTAAQEYQISQARLSSSRKMTKNLVTKTPVRMQKTVMSLQQFFQSNEGSPVLSRLDSLDEAGVMSGLDDMSVDSEFVPDSGASDSEEECHILHNYSKDTASDGEDDDSLSEISSCLSEVYGNTLEGVLAFQAKVESGRDVCKVCPGCSSQQHLSSRNFNIAIETSSVTCGAHRRVRQLERDFIWKRACRREQLRKKIGHVRKHKVKAARKVGQGQLTSPKDVKSAPHDGCRPLSMCEERRLRRAVARLGHDWTAVLHSSHFAAGRTAEQLRDHWALACNNGQARRKDTIRS